MVKYYDYNINLVDKMTQKIQEFIEHVPFSKWFFIAFQFIYFAKTLLFLEVVCQLIFILLPYSNIRKIN